MVALTDRGLAATLMTKLAETDPEEYGGYAETLNAAAAINRAEKVGSLEVGKQADIVIWDAPNLDYVFYRFGQNLVKTVIKKGQIV